MQADAWSMKTIYNITILEGNKLYDIDVIPCHKYLEVCLQEMGIDPKSYSTM